MEAIESVRLQTYSNWEMIIVDDCSTDNSVGIVKSFADSRIRLLQNEKCRSRYFEKVQTKGSARKIDSLS